MSVSSIYQQNFPRVTEPTFYQGELGPTVYLPKEQLTCAISTPFNVSFNPEPLCVKEVTKKIESDLILYLINQYFNQKCALEVAKLDLRDSVKESGVFEETYESNLDCTTRIVKYEHNEKGWIVEDPKTKVSIHFFPEQCLYPVVGKVEVSTLTKQKRIELHFATQINEISQKQDELKILEQRICCALKQRGLI